MSADDEVTFELDEWEPHERDAVTAALTRARIDHDWEGTTLVIAASAERAVERVLDQVDEELDLELEPELDKVAYDLGSWSAGARGALIEALADSSIPHGWVDDELIVHEEDEVAVDELIARVDRGDTDAGAPGDATDAAPGDDEGGDDDEPTEPPASAELVGELFVAADRLLHDPHDHEGTLSLMDAGRVALESSAPFGFEPPLWESILDQVGQLVLLVGQQDLDDDAVIAGADALRTTLRPLV